MPKRGRAAPIARVAIIGAGTMGGGIAMACANAGLDVILTDAAQPALDRGLATIGRNYDASVKRGRLTADAVAERLGRIHGHVGYDGVETADLVIEAVFESLALKQQVFAELDAIAKPDAVHGDQHLDAGYRRHRRRRRAVPASVVGLHFFSPANVMRLVEIVRGSATSPQVIATALALAKRLGKVGVVVGNGPGFVGNRMMFPYMYEAQFLVEDGATPEAGRSRAHRLGHGDGHLCRRRPGRAGCGVAGAPGARAVRGSRAEEAAPGGPALRAGTIRPEDRQGLVPLRRRPHADSRSGGARVDRNRESRCRHSAPDVFARTRSSSGRSSR